MRLLLRTFTDARGSFAQYWLELTTPSPRLGIDRIIDIRAIKQAASREKFELTLATNLSTLQLRQAALHDPGVFLQAASQLVIHDAGSHPNGPLLLVDDVDDAKCPTVDRLDVTITLGPPGYNNVWRVSVDGWPGRLRPVLNCRDAISAIRKGGYEVTFGDLPYLEVSRPYDPSLTQRGWRQAMKAQAEHIGQLVLPHLRVRQPRRCRFTPVFPGQ